MIMNREAIFKYLRTWMDQAVCTTLEEEDAYHAILTDIWCDEMNRLENDAVREYLKPFMDRFYFNEQDRELLQHLNDLWAGRPKMIDKNKILKYYEYKQNVSRANDPILYHFLMREIENIKITFTKDENDYIDALIQKSQIDNKFQDAINVYIIDTLHKDTLYMNTIFETKEQYIAFRNKWKEIAADLRSKRSVVGRGSRKVDGNWVGFDITESSLSLPYHVVFLAATGKLESGMKNLHFHTRIFLRHYGASSAVLSAFGETLTEPQKHMIEQTIHEFAKLRY